MQRLSAVSGAWPGRRQNPDLPYKKAFFCNRILNNIFLSGILRLACFPGFFRACRLSARLREQRRAPPPTQRRDGCADKVRPDSFPHEPRHPRPGSRRSGASRPDPRTERARNVPPRRTELHSGTFKRKKRIRDQILNFFRMATASLLVRTLP